MILILYLIGCFSLSGIRQLLAKEVDSDLTMMATMCWYLDSEAELVSLLPPQSYSKANIKSEY